MMRNSEETKHTFEDITYFTRPDIEVDGKTYERLAIQTHFVERGEDYLALMKRYVVPMYKENDVLSIGEKVMSMCQNNIVEKKDVKLGFWAKFLSRFAMSTSAGVAMDEPYKLQLAIDIAGLPRILLASFCSAVTKLFGKHGVFYKIAGHGIDGIDGFYMRSSFDIYHDIAVLNPKNPEKIVKEIYDTYGIKSMIVDANDLSISIFAKCEELNAIDDKTLIGMIGDNPAGQSDELTPFILIKEKYAASENTSENK